MRTRPSFRIAQRPAEVGRRCLQSRPDPARHEHFYNAVLSGDRMIAQSERGAALFTRSGTTWVRTGDLSVGTGFGPFAVAPNGEFYAFAHKDAIRIFAAIPMTRRAAPRPSAPAPVPTPAASPAAPVTSVSRIVCARSATHSVGESLLLTTMRRANAISTLCHLSTQTLRARSSLAFRYVTPISRGPISTAARSAKRTFHARI